MKSIDPSFWQDAKSRFLKAPLVKFSFFLLTFIVLFSLLFPFISSKSPYELNLTMRNVAPNSFFWLGTDELGRDLLARVLAGIRISLSIAISAALIDLTIGIFWGTLAAFLGGWKEEMLLRLCDILQAIPYLLIVILLTVLRGSGMGTILIAMSCTGWIPTARIVRAEISKIKTLDYLKSARAIGASSFYIIKNYLIPNAIGPIIASATLTIPSAIFSEAFLSFLGLGIQAPDASLGVMISDSLGAIRYYPWRLFVPSIAITLLLFSLHLMSQSLRDAIDPKLKEPFSFYRKINSSNYFSKKKSSLLEIQNLSIEFPFYGRKIKAADQINFSLKQEEKVGIIGESGSGKSSTLSAIAQLISSSFLKGKILWEGKDLSLLDDQEIQKIRGKEIAIVFQDPNSFLNPTMTIQKQIEEALICHNYPKKEALSLLKKVKMPNPEAFFKSYPHELSGGMKQKALIAISLACRPKLLILDEPTASLDEQSKNEMIQILKDPSLVKSVLIVSHDLDFLSKICDRILVFKEGKIIEEGATETILKSPKNPYTKLLVAHDRS